MGESVELNLYRCSPPVVDAEYDRGGPKSLAETLIGALAQAEGVSATALPPVYDAIDLDAIRQLFDRQDADTGAVLGFTFNDWNVFVRTDGRIRVCDGTTDTTPEPVFAERVV